MRKILISAVAVAGLVSFTACRSVNPEPAETVAESDAQSQNSAESDAQSQNSAETAEAAPAPASHESVESGHDPAIGPDAAAGEHIILHKMFENGEIPENMIGCEVRIQVADSFYSAQALAFSIEEALDHAVAEACAQPCANSLESAAISDEERESKIDACADKCADETNPVDAECMQNGQTIYTGGSFNEPAESDNSDNADAG